MVARHPRTLAVIVASQNADGQFASGLGTVVRAWNPILEGGPFHFFRSTLALLALTGACASLGAEREQPAALAHEEWVSDWQRATTLDAIMLPPAADDVAVELEAPVLPPPLVREEAEEDVLEAGHRDADQARAAGSANARPLIR